ncbi:hypothetical protein A0H81_12335 [Grifola frondosa]|uniref:Methyltransferase domain-containing protein n=1 Tax=Grifola frondosa TaxID=5627 RepID=A0A1C7LV15_GRIFR|nr:hypothetical protein A0H81_12335 [Grifola frondosa]
MPFLAMDIYLHLQDHALAYSVLLSLLTLCAYFLLHRWFTIYWKFFYACFLKPIGRGKDSSGQSLQGQQHALESFYKTQASIYDATRGSLLCGRDEMLRLAATQMLHRAKESKKQPIWVDIGGGTGHNIERMNSFVSVPEFFSTVYLVDLSPSLCEVARQRFAKLGWKNVTVVCQDARTFSFDPEGAKGTIQATGDHHHTNKADYISMSYSLSMIPDFYSVIDSMTELLAPSGLISCVDFYVQSASSYSLRTFTGGHHSRHVNWFSRLFWRSWFQFDRVHLDEGRRDYLEYRFGTILNVNKRNYKLGGIPYYIWIGCPRSATWGTLAREAAERIDALATESPYLSPVHYSEKRTEAAQAEARETRLQLRSKGFEAAILNLATNVPLPSFFYQNQRWRLYYDEALPKHTQFGNQYIYAFTWEDPAEDHRLLGIGKDDVVFAITSAGDNVLSYALRRPRSIHAVDLNPTQNHLLELKIAAFCALPYADTWKLFGEGRHPDFRRLLLDKLSPYSRRARSRFYETGGTRLAVKLSKWLFRVLGLTAQVRRLCEAKTLREQRAIWHTALRPVVLSKLLSFVVVANEQFLWRALGVPANQRDMISEDAARAPGAPSHARRCGSMWCRPEYLSEDAHAMLSKPGAFDGLRIHTDEFVEVLARIKPETVTVAVIMDHMDWFDQDGPQATEEIRALNNAMKAGGRVLLRSAGLSPWYIAKFAEQGFSCKRVAARVPGRCIDRVNMYASTWICTKTAPAVSVPAKDKIGTNGEVEALEL